MASYGVFSVKDVKAEAFHHPFFTHNAATAERNFRRMLGDEQGELWRSPEDFELYQVAIWNDELGVIVAPDGPELVITAKAIMDQVKER